MTTAPRSIFATLKSLPSYLVAPSILTPTILHSTLPTLISSSTPLFLRSNLRIDPILTPTAYSICTFLSSTAELFLRLPVETALRRGQIHEVATHEVARAGLDAARGRPGRSARPRRHDAGLGATSSDDELHQVLEDDPLGASRASILSAPVTTTGKLKTIVHVGPYVGLMSTVWRIVREEGESVSKTRAIATTRKGQGVHGLWRGWRVGWWGLVGVWVVAGMGSSGGRGGEF